jgi:hypothetical protein
MIPCGCPVLTGGVIHNYNCPLYPKPMSTPQYLRNDRELLLEIIQRLNRIEMHLNKVRKEGA